MKYLVTIDRDEDGVWIPMSVDSRMRQSSATKNETLVDVQDLVSIQDAEKSCLEVRSERGRELTVETLRVEAIG